MTLVQTEPKKLYIRVDVEPLCFTANTAGSKVMLYKIGSPYSITIQTSTNGDTWNTYTFGNRITLSNVGDKVYFRNTSETTTGFSSNTNSRYIFNMEGSIAASGDITFLINKNGTDTIAQNYCFYSLFNGCSALTSAPKLPATTLKSNCYQGMFSNCTGLTSAPELPATTLFTSCCQSMFANCSNLETLPILPATTLANNCYAYMFQGCSKIKISATQTGEYQTEYRIPITGTGTDASGALTNMFTSTGGTFAQTPTINTTYYTSNTLV